MNMLCAAGQRWLVRFKGATQLEEAQVVLVLEGCVRLETSGSLPRWYEINVDVELIEKMKVAT